MKRTPLLSFVLLAGCSGFLIGCQPSQEEMATMFKQPPRPAELDRLEAFVGTWKADVEVTMAGSDEVHTSTGQNTTQWAADKWMLTENWEHDMGKTDTMKGVSLMWWDGNSKKYRMSFTDNYGGHGTGSMTYNEETGVWKFKSKSKDGKSGSKTIGKGTMKFVNPSTIEWFGEEYDGTGLFKIITLKGTSRRQ